MSAEIIELYQGNLDERKLQKVVECLKNGGIIIYPTDTVYSMGCDIFNSKAVEKLSKIKGIKLQHNTFSIFCHDLSNISTYAKVSNNTFRLLKRALPGPFTFILQATGDLPKTLQTKR